MGTSPSDCGPRSQCRTALNDGFAPAQCAERRSRFSGNARGSSCTRSTPCTPTRLTLPGQARRVSARWAGPLPRPGPRCSGVAAARSSGGSCPRPRHRAGPASRPAACVVTRASAPLQVAGRWHGRAPMACPPSLTPEDAAPGTRTACAQYTPRTSPPACRRRGRHAPGARPPGRRAARGVARSRPGPAGRVRGSPGGPCR